MSADFLLIDGSPDDYWHKIIKEAFAPIAKVETVHEELAVNWSFATSYAVIIIDASVVKEVELLVARLHAQRPEIPIVVVTASPTWQRARAAFLAGATDYVRKTLDKDELQTIFKDVLSKSLPSSDQ